MQTDSGKWRRHQLNMQKKKDKENILVEEVPKNELLSSHVEFLQVSTFRTA